MNKSVYLAVVTAILSGCATPPSNYSVAATRTYQKNYDAVWEDVVSFFASRNIQIKNIAKDSGVIYAERARFDDSMADCGKPGIMAVVGRTVQFNVFVNRSGSQPTVTVNTTFTETRQFDRNMATVNCNSKGQLEQMILDSVKQ